MAAEGRDIGPDEVRLDYVYNGNHSSDLEEDSAGYHDHSVSDSIHNRKGFHIQEPMDTTSDAVGTIYNRVFPEERHSGCNTADFYKSEANRLSTFSDWRYQTVVKKEDLARNGFVYTGSADKVRCVYCNGHLRQWERGDVVEGEHRKSFPTCPFLKGKNVGNIPLEAGSTSTLSQNPTFPDPRHVISMSRGYDIDPEEEGYASRNSHPRTLNRTVSSHEDDAVCSTKSPSNPRMAMESERLATFSGWPAQMKQKPSVLAQAGLYYIGDGDKVKCFHCDTLLFNWETDDDPFVEHARWFPDCPYIRLVKGEAFVEDVRNGKLTQEEAMQTPAVLAVLYDGHSMETVQRALAAIRQKNGPNVVVSAHNLLMAIMELEEDGTVSPSATCADVTALETLQRDYELLRDKQLCKICMAQDVDVIFFPCKHLVCCASCSAPLQCCPICRVHIDHVEKVFMA